MADIATPVVSPAPCAHCARYEREKATFKGERRSPDDIAHYYERCAAQSYLAAVAVSALRDAGAPPDLIRRAEDFLERSRYVGD